MNMQPETVNWLAVGILTVAGFVLGGAWYAGIFRKAFERAHGYTQEDIERMSQVVIAPLVGVFLLTALLAGGMAILASATGVETWMDGLKLGGLVWLGIATPFQLMNDVSHRRKPLASAIDLGFQLVALLLIGTVLGAWQ